MTKSHAIEHFDGEDAHGPVTLFISDEGRMAFVCSKDNATWELDVTAKPQSARTANEEIVDAAPADVTREFAPRAKMMNAARRALR